ncbi:MAG TPA: DUF4124 domain-containing protein [Steroidobacteraceae bacterium]|jgi:hypothetical protein|nr:DUF4124 domain-containing protein [Steroidobacteraceae bacterium]
MHPWRPWILLAGLAAFGGQAAVVYKWTDADGVVHYSDQSVPGAEKIYTAGGTSAARGSAPGDSSSATDTKKEAPLGYTEFAITSPTPEQTFFGDEVVAVNLTLDPALKPDQTITWHLNGKELSDQGPTAAHFALPRLDRGAYVIAATITDPASGESRTSDSVTFYVRQPSELSPQHKNP